MPLYLCDHCNFSTKIKTQYNQHLSTKKHIRNTKDLPCETEIIENPVKKSSTKEHKSR